MTDSVLVIISFSTLLELVASQAPLPIKKIEWPAIIVVNEDLPIGTLLAKLSVTGGKNPRLNSSSEYVSLIHTFENSTYATYDALLIKALDFETMGSTVSVPCTESNDYYSKIPCILQVYIRDVNDETPVFLNRPYSINVAENATVGHVVYDLIKANDADLSDRQLKYYFEVDLKITDTDYKSKFVINQSTAQVTLNETLDYETARFYQYTVVVRDSNKHNATTDVFITIEDVQDEPPYFTGTPYLISVQENSKVGTSLLVVKAEDGDRGLSNTVTYKILNETCPGLFEITPASGEVRLKSVPDRDKGIVHDNNGICTLTVEAKEGQTYPQSIPGRDVRTEEVTIAIEDVDDNEPQFNLKSYDAIVAENTPNGVPITLSSAMKVEDIDQGPNAHFNVRVLNLTNEFEASPSIVQSTADIIIRVKDTNYLDYEKREKILILIEAKPVNAADSATGNTVVVTLNLTNVNDETPKFRSFQQTVSVQENVVIHYTVATVLANDTDQNDDGQNFGKVTYRIDPPDANFGIDSTRGLISTKTTLDRETKDSYYITIVAEDGGHSKVTNQMLIKITDVNDNSPSFVTDDYQTSLQEMDTKFARPVIVHATDNDEPGSPNSKVSYLIVSSTPSNLLTHFSMDSSSGALTVKSPLLYENVFSGHGQNQGNIILIVMAKDNGVPPRNSTVNVTVMLQDINNQRPVCSQSKYTTSRAEDSVLDVATVHATDKDGTAPNYLILYSIDQSSSEKFIIDSSSGKITLRSQLDREVQHHYIIAVTVTDLGNPPLNGSCQVEVEVTDVNDSPPVFKEKAVTTNIKENTIFSYELVANDSDLNPNLSYSIDWDKSSGLKVNGESVDGSELKNWIQIQDPHHCKVISKKNFDRETITKMTIELLVKDLNGKVNVPQTDSATLVVDILDVNDNAPFLNGGPTLVASVRENMPINSSVTFVTPTSLEITDPDEKGPNSEYQVKIEDVKNIFDISPTLGEGHQTFTIVVKNSTALDYEKIQSHTVKIIAKNQALSTTATVTINILNENDNVPLFEKSTYSASVAEMSPPHANVTSSIKAIDKDLGSYGVVSYFLTDDSGKFQIDKNTGYVSTRTGDLDRETKSSYTLIITAKDVNGFSSLTQLTVTVTDINDQSPVFDQQNFAITIEEGEKKFLPSFFVHATDADDPKSQNSQVEYSLIHATTAPLSNFNLGSASGELLMLSPLNFEALSNNGVIVLHVQAKDKGQPAHSSSATITVTVLDINDEKPVFPKSLYRVNISESASTGQSVTQLHATDKDKSSTNNQVSYSIDALSNSKFSINATTGEITVKDVLDREQVDHYSIIVTAADNGQPVQTSTATVSVTVTDVNDSPPQFYKKSVSVQITENVHQVITVFDARDADLNPDLVYSIEWSSSSGVDGHGQFLSGDTLKGYITINPHTGEVSTVNVLDRESIKRFQLTVQVEDVNGTRGTNQLDNAVLTVVVDDVNDNPPKFNGGPYFTAEVQENMPNGSEVKLDGVSGLYIEDPDGVNNNIFNITVSQNNAFSIGPLIGTGSSTCVIKVAHSTLLDYEKVQSFTITVVAYDTKNRSLSSEATIFIKLINENDNIPEFIGAPFHGKISENSKSNTHITTVKAHDADLGLFGQISYFLIDDANKFVINSTTGEVYSLVDDLDRETKANYILTVLAKDYSNFTAQAQLSIDVTDIDDETPVFLNLAYEFNINEIEIKSLTGFYVHATDADDPTTANSIVNYTLIHTEPNNYSSYFNMNISTGELMILKALDYEELVSLNLTAVTLTVQATDQGLAALSATSHIRVKVLDINDNSPIFELNPYSFSVPENSIK
ncbi:cadherin-23, partial [Biomphalaria pfeifferi]